MMEKKLEITARELQNIRYALDKAAIVAITDKTGAIIHVNQKFCDISKYSREELIGQNHRLINSGFHPKEFWVEMWQTVASGKVWEAEVKNRAKDGSFYWVATCIVPFLDDGGRPYQYVSIRYDITRRKMAEENLRLYARKLELSNRELQDFASIAAHDLQEPLRKIEAFSDRLEKKIGHELVGDAHDYLERMVKAARRMRTLIDDLLTYSRVGSKAQPFVETDLTEVVQEVLSDLEVRLEQSRAVVEVKNLPRLEADPAQMRQLFQNLISNALKFHRPGVAPEVEISAEIDPEYCVIRVSDNGIGFDTKYLDRIFTIFQRLHSRQEYEGTGVGLAVCRRIVDRHGGEITAESVPGEGATFIVTLPLRQMKEDS
jgi:two-component system, LuxR family, sensor kinase FixL